MRKSLVDKKPPFFKAHAWSIAWTVVIMVLCFMPGDQVPDIDFWDINLTDKFAHFAVFALLALLMVRAEQGRQRTRSLSFGHKAAIIAVCILLGAIIEGVQGWFIPTRYASAGDVLADALGAVLGTVFAPWILNVTGLHCR